MIDLGKVPRDYITDFYGRTLVSMSPYLPIVGLAGSFGWTFN